jgi:hypothetical protein
MTTMSEAWKRLIWSMGYFTAVTRGTTEAMKKLAKVMEDDDDEE